jgi:nitroimidazol reductase NimA-like FMN-containing flavoprotein (pyridoxamine 5'-phosphate oxidase superfamily)
MPRDYTARAATAVRRADRAVEDDGWIRDVLRAAPYGTLATAHDGQPFLNGNLFAYDPERHAIYLHTARVGRTPANVRAGGADGAPVCFAGFAMGRLLPAAEALEFSVEYEGVTVFGRGRVVADPAEAERGLQLILDKYAPHLRPGRDYRPIAADELRRTAVYRVDVSGWVGKRKSAPPDFPGAFVYGAAPPGEAPASTSAS